MRRDVCYFFPADVPSVYNAYLAAATNAQFRRQCNETPYHTIGFGLNFSMKYNMNGGSCILHFMPMQGGTGVDLRFTIAQLAGARYERYATDLTNTAAAILRLPSQRIVPNVEEFLRPENQITPDKVAAVQKPTLPEAPVEPAEPAKPATPGKFCSQCGTALEPGDKFCNGCGTPVVKAEKTCPACGATAKPQAAFCSNCGQKL